MKVYQLMEMIHVEATIIACKERMSHRELTREVRQLASGLSLVAQTVAAVPGLRNYEVDLDWKFIKTPGE